MSTWYTIVTKGTACTVPRGPWRSTWRAKFGRAPGNHCAPGMQLRASAVL